MSKKVCAKRIYHDYKSNKNILFLFFRLEFLSYFYAWRGSDEGKSLFSKLRKSGTWIYGKLLLRSLILYKYLHPEHLEDVQSLIHDQTDWPNVFRTKVRNMFYSIEMKTS